MIYYTAKETKGETSFLEEVRDERYTAKTETVFAQCNGYIGVRAAFELSVLEETRGTFLTGLYHKASVSEVSELVNCPDVTELGLSFNGEKIYPDRCEIQNYQRELCIKSGELKILMTLKTAKGQSIEFRSRRFASKDNRHLFVHEIMLVPKQKGTLTVSNGINGQITNSGAAHFAKTEARVFQKQTMYTENICDDGQTLYVMTGTYANKAEEKKVFGLKRKSIYEHRTFEVREEEPISLLKISCFQTKDDADKLETKQMEQLVNESLAEGYEILLKAHKKEMDKFWRYASVKLEGASLEEQTAIDFALYHMQGMTPSCLDPFSVGAKGLTGEGYKGHVFWDAELFVMPFFTAVFPETARNLLKYRYKGLPGARKKAEQYHYEGAMYPWESAKTGEEETPLFAALNIHTGVANRVWSGIKEHHVTADIVYALWDYCSVTQDVEFLREYGSRIIIETAIFWESRSSYNEEKDCIEILDIIGPDEYTEHIDNNAYSNYMARENVALALKLTKSIKDLNEQYDLGKWTKKWEKFLQKIYLPKANKEGIIPQDDTFLNKAQMPQISKYKESPVKQAVLLDYSRDEIINMQVLKQADVVMLLNLMPQLFSPEIIQKNVEFYEARTIHDSSLSYCAHAIASARIKDLEAADRFFEKALEIDLDENYMDSTDGIHSASLGGIWNCLIQGYAGVTHRDGTVCINPHLPERWKSMEFYHKAAGVYYRIKIGKNKVEIIPEQMGCKGCFEIEGMEYSIEKESVIKMKEQGA